MGMSWEITEKPITTQIPRTPEMLADANDRYFPLHEETGLDPGRPKIDLAASAALELLIHESLLPRDSILEWRQDDSYRFREFRRKFDLPKCAPDLLRTRRTFSNLGASYREIGFVGRSIET